MNFNFNKKNALVTGGSRGIGKQIVNDLKSLGANVISLDSSDFDLSSDKSLGELNDFINSQKAIDLLVNNAGINFHEQITELDEEKYNDLMNVNIKSPFFITKIVGNKMKKNKYGRIVNIASIAGDRVREGRSAYSASKAGMIAFTKVAAVELAPYGILCNSVSPGFTLTEMTKKMMSKEQIKKHEDQIPLGRLGQPRDISSAVIYLLSDLNSFITGQNLIVDGGFINSITIQ